MSVFSKKHISTCIGQLVQKSACNDRLHIFKENDPFLLKDQLTLEIYRHMFENRKRVSAFYK